MRRLILFHCLNRGIVPFPVRRACIRTISRQCALNFRNSIRRRRFLPRLPPRTLFSFFRSGLMRTGRAGWRFLFCRRTLRLRSLSRYTQPCYKNKQQGWENDFSADHCLLFSSYWTFSAGTTPGKNTVRIRSLSCRRRTLNTTFCPGLSLVTADL